MLKTLNNGMTGMSSQMLKLDVIGNNISNMETTGFKKQSVGFSELVRQRMSAQGIPVLDSNADPFTQGSGTKVSSITREFDPGSLIFTENKLDFAIAGNGFFKLTRNDGEVLYTRDGVFHVDSDGQIVNSKGLVLLDEELPDNFTDLAVDAEGNITCKDEDGNVQDVGQIEITVFPNPAGMTEMGGNLYAYSEEAGEPQSLIPGEEYAGSIKQGYLEGSNVDMVVGMQSLIEAQRSFQMNSKSVTTADQMWNITNNLQK